MVLLPNVIRDEIPAPREFIQIEYRGPNPLKVYHSLNQLLRTLWEIKGTQLYEPDFRWDITTDPRPFFIQVFAERNMIGDKFTTWRVDIKMQGSQPTDPTKDGVLRIEIHGWIDTKFPTGNALNRFLFPIFFWPYHVAFYAKQRRKYLEWHRRRIDKLVDEIRTMLKIPSKPAPSETLR